MSPSSRRAWIEITFLAGQYAAAEPSPSSRRAWIEIFAIEILSHSQGVALLAEGVDRNTPIIYRFGNLRVALLAEGVDRNGLTLPFGCVDASGVALLAEGVDRNFATLSSSPPSWRVALLAEGVDRNSLEEERRRIDGVALLAEGVDRNYSPAVQEALNEVSPSSRRAWIEIPMASARFSSAARRPPRGGRG